MVEVDKSIIARLKVEGKVFEILVDCDNALLYKKGDLDSLEDVLATKEIFSDVKKGERANEKDLRHCFKSEDPKEIASKIIKNGEVQLTTEHKNKLREEKRKQIVTFIHRNAINPQTGHPHTVERIEMVLDEIKVNIDLFRDVESQIQEVMKGIREKMPIKIEVWEVEIVVPTSFTGGAYGVLKKSGKVLKEEWLSNGDLKVLLEIPAGMQEKLENKMNSLTKGTVSLEIKNKR